MQGFSENVFIAAKSVTNVLKVSHVQNSSAYQRKTNEISSKTSAWRQFIVVFLWGSYNRQSTKK